MVRIRRKKKYCCIEKVKSHLFWKKKLCWNEVGIIYSGAIKWNNRWANYRVSSFCFL